MYANCLHWRIGAQHTHNLDFVTLTKEVTSMACIDGGCIVLSRYSARLQLLIFLQRAVSFYKSFLLGNSMHKDIATSNNSMHKEIATANNFMQKEIGTPNNSLHGDLVSANNSMY